MLVARDHPAIHMQTIMSRVKRLDYNIVRMHVDIVAHRLDRVERETVAHPSVSRRKVADVSTCPKRGK